jgi:hypothetical protein
MTTFLSPGTIETLIDLVEIKISMIMVTDGETRRELRNLERCLSELKGGSARPRIVAEAQRTAA